MSGPAVHSYTVDLTLTEIYDAECMRPKNVFFVLYYLTNARGPLSEVLAILKILLCFRSLGWTRKG